ncbi:MAG: AbrB/MazE/SpoVT family DNA-binding domain-containing protein [Candidatus Nitrosopelagicus sp.]|jgi:AbrB family looped-hinge helix DNA binding protein|nr:AbrB/MazE/SpoVT family DNA-binding domain-containing protein [Candidatus Nitrosopelagicus sp.]MBT4327306.1 AbrB/MazE/SpoVT family DNA-binding domain-containing protein [Candidatus Nitrosopelagicus sp.]MBT7253218.1 AbrB/MazE/SpoVT family DNA-binding domain-containing protein [Candidatus Nitrosopelagicus sp.]
MSNEIIFTTISSKGQIVIPKKVRKKLDIKDGNIFTITEKKGLIVLKKQSLELTQDDIVTLESINDAWNEIQNNKGGKSNTKKFFAEFAKW